MVWQCGIDEAGYGPNLGPFVMTLAALGLPDDMAEANLWHEWASIVKKAGLPRDDRIIVDDSKAVYTPATGVGSLERHLLPFLAPGPATLGHLWTAHVLTPTDQWLAEPWHRSEINLPVAPGAHRRKPVKSEESSAGIEEPAAGNAASSRFSLLGAPSILFSSVVIFPPLFNLLVNAANSKAAAPLWALGLLCDELQGLAPTGEVANRLALDRLGGRHHYSALLREQFFGCRVDVLEESAARGRYHLGLRNGRWRLQIEPKADQNYFAVALASMFSKYLREVLMLQFNSWWCAQQAGLVPTAGYPVDANRWWNETKATRDRLHIADERLWRRR